MNLERDSLVDQILRNQEARPFSETFTGRRLDLKGGSWRRKKERERV